MKPGDSLYGIARAHKVKFAELQQVNGITDVRRVKPGTVLKVPGEAMGGPSPARVAQDGPMVPPIAAIDKSAESRYGSATIAQPTIINGGEHREASLSDRANDASPSVEPPQKEQKVAIAAPTGAAPDTGDSVKLRWPASGRIIAGFGGRPDGTHNDGVNVAAPLGTDVHAAESGVVAYAGDELKGYGNLVLIRHDNGWVTAYAHADEIMVKRGDRIKRGQVIAKAGRTGQVDQPQVHFELRQGQKPVDPTPFMERM